MAASFRSCDNKGFHITFDNGWTISVQFGAGNYCSRRDINAKWDSERHLDEVVSPDAEIAIFPEGDGEWFNFGSDTVKGHVSPAEVARWIDAVSRW